MIDPVEQFKDAMSSRGLIPPAEIIADGRIHRCNAEGRGGEGDGAYLLHLDKFPAGGFQNHRDGLPWEKWHADHGRSMTTEEEKAYLSHVETMRKEWESEDRNRKAEARERAKKIWDSARPCVEHPYLERKGIQPFKVRVASLGYRQGEIVVPLRDAEGMLHSLQFIDADGGKHFLPGGRKVGCYFAMGKPAEVLCIAEGLATGASIHEATGKAVAVAFDAGNLLPVAQALQAKYPSLAIVICADDDYLTDGNPGVTKATGAAKAIKGRIAVPVFGDNRPATATDFNDLHQAEGLDAVRLSIDAAWPASSPNNQADSPQPSDEWTHPTMSMPKEKTARKRLKFTRAGDLLSVTVPPPRWTWEGWIPRARVGLLAAVSDHGKTALMLQLAAGVASGCPVLGIPTTPEPCGVLIYSLEDEPEDFQPRLNWVLEGMEDQGTLTQEDRAFVSKNLWFGEPTYDVPDLRFEKTEAEIREHLSAMRQEGITPALVIVETLSAIAEGDENKTESTRGLWTSARCIAKHEDVTVIISHHYKKESGGRSNRSSIVERVEEDRLRGAGANGCAARFVIQMGLPTTDEAESVGLDLVKAMNKGYAILRASKLKASKPSLLFLERVDCGEPGQHTWAARADGDRIISNLLKSKARIDEVDLQDRLLVEIYRQGADPDRENLKALFSGHQDPDKALTNALSRLRKRQDVQPRALLLTVKGRERAVSLFGEVGEVEDLLESETPTFVEDLRSSLAQEIPEEAQEVQGENHLSLASTPIGTSKRETDTKGKSLPLAVDSGWDSTLPVVV